MKINLLNRKINENPEQPMQVTKKRFFEIFFRMLYLKQDKTLSDNEIEYLSSLCSDIPTIISKNNLPPLIKKLNTKGLMEGKELSKQSLLYKEKFTNNVEMIFNFKINVES